VPRHQCFSTVVTSSSSLDDNDKNKNNNDHAVIGFPWNEKTTNSKFSSVIIDPRNQQHYHFDQRRCYRSSTACQQQDENKDKSSQTSSSQSSSPPSTRDETAYVRRIKVPVPQYGTDAEKAARSLADAQKERARAKTAANVRRALYGNLIICASKFAAWLSSGSSSMMSEFVYVLSAVSCWLLLLMMMIGPSSVFFFGKQWSSHFSVY
jgi:hypothetical protein